MLLRCFEDINIDCGPMDSNVVYQKLKECVLVGGLLKDTEIILQILI